MLLMLYSNKVKSNQHWYAGKIKVTKAVKMTTKHAELFDTLYMHLRTYVITMVTHYK